MKQNYITPRMKETQVEGGFILESLPTSTTEVDGGLSKGRWDEDNQRKESDTWNNGLW